ncbi:MAG: TonB family protein [Bacteroidales bacterium]|jgi:TonB family protein|nr:energy transducer TonB [Bacteroidales bacterium]MDD2264388.1 TonB family protein [Bacteroidales bacterium]MDD2831622.1 TonB family protein [Bacteroidales bacterium]MDD3209187.1 TonB family protein [Bacteroidales bacterium]MDD3697528.1 TonB family protein [Bacteroidales bacterium]
MKKEIRTGLYLTIIVHLIALIIILSLQISSMVRNESSFVLDFTQQEELEAEQMRENMRAQISAELEDMISGIQRQSRNVAVDATQRNRILKDDRYADPSKVYQEAEELQKKLDAARRALEEQGGNETVATAGNEEKKQEAKPYTGPAVLEYLLEGRKAMSLPIPVYKCLGGGDVTVSIQVDRKGYVQRASIVDAYSSQDRCLQEFALRAARQSRFTASVQAPPLQPGEIVYRFIPQ